MLNSDQIFDIIELISSDNSKLFKETVIKQHGCDELFKKVLRYAYDNNITFGVDKLPEYISKSTHAENFPVNTWSMLDKLASRELSGNAALSAIKTELEFLSPKSATLLSRIIKKDLRAGFSENTINKAIKGLIPEYPYQRCSLPEKVKLNKFSWDKGCYSQTKCDGMFANVDCFVDGSVRISSRQGKELPQDAIQALVKEGSSLQRGTRTLGELVVQIGGEDLPREVSNGIMNHLASGGSLEEGDTVVLFVWDQIPLEFVTPKGKYTTPYRERFNDLQYQVVGLDNIKLVETRVVHTLQEAYEHCSELLTLGKEGTVFKCGNGIWRDGTSTEQVKLKLDFTVELEAVELLSGKGKFKDTFGSILYKSSDNQLEVGVSGIPDDLREEIFLNWETSWKGSIGSVRANAVSKPSKSNPKYSLFLPRLIERRYDKTEADSIERIIEQQQAAINLAGTIK